MDLSDVTVIIIILILLLLCAFFTSVESALKNVSKLKIKTLADDNIRAARSVLRILDNPRNILRTIIILKSIDIIVATSLVTILTPDNTALSWLPISLGALSLVYIIMCEISPRVIGRIYAESYLLFSIGPILGLSKLLSPIVFLINLLIQGYLRLLRVDVQTKSSLITDDELRNLLEYSEEEGVIESEERRMITNVVDFGDSVAKDVMVPRIDMAFASADLTYDELVAVFAKEKYTRMPVYSESRDNVIGIVNLKDVFFYRKDKEQFNIMEILREPYYTYEYKKTSELLIEMRRQSIPISIVLDEYGATVGLITIEDLLEEIVGEIRDEYDYDEEDNIKQISDYEYIVDGNTKLDELNETLGLHLESHDYDSIAGLIIYYLDHLPSQGECVLLEDVNYTVESMDKNRIDKVHIQLPNKELELQEEPTSE